MSLDPSAIVTSLLSVENGILAGGWVLAGYLLFKLFSKKEAQETALEAAQREHAIELKSVRESHTEELKQMRLAHAEEIKGMRDAHDKRMAETEDELGEQLREATTKITDLHSAHIQVITQMADKRIEDLKSVTEDYNAMVESVRLALEKIALGLGRKR
jgi:DNA anti-recombination protein RmuC